MSLFLTGFLVGVVTSVLLILFLGKGRVGTTAGKGSGSSASAVVAPGAWQKLALGIGTIALFAAGGAYLAVNEFGRSDATAAQSRKVHDVAAQGATDPELAKMEKYLASGGHKEAGDKSAAGQSPPAQPLPDVESMISGLAKRLEAAPGDVEGWRTLGWSYLNTGRPAEAVKAYEKALAIAPDRQDLKDAMATARASLESVSKGAAPGSSN